MAILFENNIITLQTDNTSYQMKIDEHKYLLHTWYGEKINSSDDMSYRINRVDRGFSGNPYGIDDRTYSLDTLPQEYSCFGNGDYRDAAIEVIHKNGANVLDLLYIKYEIKKGMYKENIDRLGKLPNIEFSEDEGEHLVVSLKDRSSDIFVELIYSVIPNLDVISRKLKIINKGSDDIIVNKALSMSLDFLDSSYDFIHFYGKHNMEREFERTSLIHGKQSIGSLRGTSSHQHNPFIILANKETNEIQGNCYGFALMYSGSFIANVEVDQINQTRISMGIHPDTFSFILGQNEDLILPEVICTYSGLGFERLTHSYHDLTRKHILRGEYSHKHRPILINNWEATYFDFNGEKLLDIARTAKELGLEMLVMDDGWFGKRDDDKSGLGDWFVNEKKLGMSLSTLVDKVNKIGLKFGIWFEPEMISEDSELFRNHKDFMIAVPNRESNISRDQFVLDFTRKDVRDEVERMLRNILDNANIEYIKWDMNRSIANLYSHRLEAGKMGEFAYRYVLGLYELLDKLSLAYPHILFEACSGGGGRFDFAMLKYQPQVWTSDDTDAIERLKIQYGTSFAYPIGSMGSHVSASPNHQTLRDTALDTRATVAMAGSFGYELDLTKLSEKEKEMVKNQIQEYHKYDELVHEGDYFRLNSPYDETRVCAWQLMSKDKSKGLLSIVYTKLQASPDLVLVYPRGLDINSSYKIGNDIKSAKAWMRGGYKVPLAKYEYDSFRIEIEKI